MYNPNNPVVILRSRWSPHPAKVSIEGAVLYKLIYVRNNTTIIPHKGRRGRDCMVHL